MVNGKMQQYGSLCYIYIFGCYLFLVLYIMSCCFLLAVSHVVVCTVSTNYNMRHSHNTNTNVVVCTDSTNYNMRHSQQKTAGHTRNIQNSQYKLTTDGTQSFITAFTSARHLSLS
jgi:hypothetical protein